MLFGVVICVNFLGVSEVWLFFWLGVKIWRRLFILMSVFKLVGVRGKLYVIDNKIFKVIEVNMEIEVWDKIYCIELF